MGEGRGIDYSKALSSSSADVRVGALESLETVHLAAKDWYAVRQYLVETLAAQSELGPDERKLAIDVGVRAPFREVHDLIERCVVEGAGEYRARAAMALCRIGNVTAGRVIVDLLDDDSVTVSREELAEHLLLVDVRSFATRLHTMIDDESDSHVRFFIAGALADAGDQSVLTDEVMSGAIPPRLRALVHASRAGADGATAFTVRPRITAIGTPQYFDEPGVAGGEPPLEVRDDDPPPPTSEADEPPRRPRFFEGRGPDEASLGETVAVEARVSLAPAAGSTASSFDLEVPPQGIDLPITIYAPGFELSGPNLLRLHVPPDEDSGWIVFELRAARPGTHDIALSAYHPEGRQLSAVALRVNVSRAAAGGTTHAVRAALDHIAGEPGELTLQIDWLARRRAYCFKIIDPSLPDDVYGRAITPTPRQVVETLIKDVNAIARSRTNVAGGVREWLRDQGIDLWRDLVPPALQQQYWDRESQIKSLRIVAQRDPVPWELLCPLAPGHDLDDRFLVERFPVFRGVRNIAPTSPIGAGVCATVLPARNAPTSATSEVDSVRTLWRARGAPDPIDGIAGLRALLKDGQFGALHFACHNIFDPEAANHARIRLGDTLITPSVLARAIATKSLQTSRPIVFMNACRTGATAPLYTDFAGWASNFVTAGAAAFIGSLWEIRDKPARAFAEKFYEELLDGMTLGQAVKSARASIDSPDDPTWLAYTVYGHPSATLEGAAL